MTTRRSWRPWAKPFAARCSAAARVTVAGYAPDVHLAILDRFSGEGLDMAFPTQTIYTHKASA